jgi:hypothetical protein
MEQFSSLPPVKSYFLGFFTLLLALTANAQKDTINRYPTQAEMDEKLAILERSKYETPLGKMDSLMRIMVTGPEQNCKDAIPVCVQTYTQSTSYTGVGTIDEVKNCCLKSGEKNSVWYVFTTQTAGNFGFTINTVKDYDFAIYDITTMGCEGVPTATPTVCNYSSTKGQTGMVSGGLASNSEPASGLPFCGLLAVTAGKTYVLIVSNYTGDATGYTLTFTIGGGYTSITDVIAPTINPPNSVVNNCDNTLTVNLSEPVKCSTIAANGSDFTISGGGTITAAAGVGCSTNAYVSQVLVTYTAPSTGTYTLGIASGSDGNTLLDKCSNAMATSQTVTFNHLVIALSASPTSICTSGSAVTLTATGANAGGTYTLTPGGTSNTTGSFTVNPNVTTTYVVTVTYGGCTKTATTTVSVLSNVVATIYPINPTICSGTTTLTASAIVNGTSCPTCTYSWAPGGATTQAITVGSGTYTVTVVKPGSTCNATASSTVSLVSAGGGTNCNIYYVSPTGTGSGFSPSDPTSIDAALDAATCAGAIIKMQTGTYNLSDKLTITSYTTMEGGYNSTFTIKTSDMSSGNATTLVRDETPDGGTGTNVTTIEAAASTVGFRIQDIRIEMADEVSGAQLTNYGIKLGASCSGYKINRCFIDAGAGSD